MAFLRNNGVKVDTAAGEENNITEEADTFAQMTTANPALQESWGVASDIYEKLFDGLFKGALFDRWARHKDTWQLHVVGGPGAGKTTFAALAAMRIGEIYAESVGHNTHVATAFIQDGRVENDLTFLEGFLASLYKQLTPLGCSSSSVTLSAYKEYKSARYTGTRASERINHITQALRQRISEIYQTGHAFLIVDSLDQCSSSLKELLQRELSALQDEGLKIMVTSRLPRHETIKDVWCDFHDFDSYLEFYWHCTSCEKDICKACKGHEMTCISCDTKSVWTAPDLFTMFIDTVDAGSIREFIAWDLEREHGDIGFGTLSNSLETPLSSFGIAFRKIKPGIIGRDWVQEIGNRVGGSIVQAKLVLDRIHSSMSPNLVDLNPERIPANVRATFNATIKGIEGPTSTQRELALKSIAMVGQIGDISDGLPLSILAKNLRTRPDNATRSPRWSAQEIVDAANGCLRITIPWGSYEEKYAIATFSPLFHEFVRDEYNSELLMAQSQLRTSSLHRSLTLMPPQNRAEKPDQSLADVIEDLRRLQSPSLPSASEYKLALTRSQTFSA